MVLAGGLELSLEHAVDASVVREKSPPVTASANVAAKPPKPPAPKTVSSPTAGPVAAHPDPPAAVVAPQAPVRLEPDKVAPAAVVVPPVSPVLAAPVTVAAPAALGDDLVLAAVSATTGGPAPGWCLPRLFSRRLQHLRWFRLGSCVVRSLPIAAHHDPIRPPRAMSGSPRVVDRSLLSAAHRAGTGTRDGVGAEARGEANQQLPRATAAPPPVAPPVIAPAAVAPQPPAPPAPYPSFLPCDSASRAAGVAQPFETFVGSSRAAEVPEATLGQLWRLSEGLRAVHLIQMYGHAGLSLGNTLVGGSWDECLDAADRLAELLAPVLAGPARGGVAGVGQLGTAVRGLRRFLRAGTAADVIGASTAVVRELHHSLTGLLAFLDADQF
ncbi:unnamed protein product [Closterium sp. Naga37s-1]|nr:unnamed protein product [Closterium sp. Naga37s-1]